MLIVVGRDSAESWPLGLAV